MSKVCHLQVSGHDGGFDRSQGRPPVTGDKGLGATLCVHPGGIGVGRVCDQGAQESFREKRHVARDDQDVIGARGLKRGQDPAQRTKALDAVGEDWKFQISEPLGTVPDQEDLTGDELQRFDLSNDDGATVDDQTALVASAESACATPSQDGGGRRLQGHIGSMMSRHEVRLGRVFVTALHQAISEELPSRADFYEHWLSADRMRDGGLGLAPLAAVLGFLRTERAGYGRVVERAGRLTGEWAWQARAPWRRTWTLRLPAALRTRVLARWVTALVTEGCPRTHAVVRVHRGVCDVEVTGSVFCGAREVPSDPLCGYYGALILALFGCAKVLASGRMEICCAGADKNEQKRDDQKTRWTAKCTGRLAILESA